MSEQKDAPEPRPELTQPDDWKQLTRTSDDWKSEPIREKLEFPTAWQEALKFVRIVHDEFPLDPPSDDVVNEKVYDLLIALVQYRQSYNPYLSAEILERVTQGILNQKLWQQ